MQRTRYEIRSIFRQSITRKKREALGFKMRWGWLFVGRKTGETSTDRLSVQHVLIDEGKD